MTSADTETLDLVISILPLVKKLLEAKINRFKDYVPLWEKSKTLSEYVATIRPSIEIFLNYVTPTEGIDGPLSEFLVSGIAHCLENLFSADILKGAVRVDPYPRLHAAVAAASKLTEASQLLLQTMFLAFSNPDYWAALLTNLKFMVARVQSGTNTTLNNLPTRPTARASKGDHENAWEFSDRLFRALRCTCAKSKLEKPDRHAMLGLDMWKGVGLDAMRKSCILVNEKGKWHRLLITSTSTQPSVHFTRHAGMPDPRESPSEGSGCLCEHLYKNHMPEKLQQTLILGRQALQFTEGQRVHKDASSAENLVSLRNLIEARPEHWKPASRLTLALILASSLCDLYGGAWMKGGWSPTRIRLSKNGPLIHLQAFLETQQLFDRHADLSGSPQRSGFNIYPDIRELGLVLLEIHLGERLETYLQLSDPPPPLSTMEDIYTSALNILEAESASFYHYSYWCAIDTCLRFANVAGPRLNDKEVRQALFQKIVEPLGKELKGLAFFQRNLPWSARIDEQIAVSDELAIRMAPMGKKLLPNRGQRQKVPDWGHQGQERLVSPELIQSSLPPDNRTPGQSGSDEWMRTFEMLWMERFGKEHTRRVKVAILDSGIDYDHTDFLDNSKRGRIVEEPKSWVDNQPKQDDCGHGTHIAGTMLRLVRNIDLCIGKISKRNTFEDANAIVQGIKHARETWKVDMISLSFAFEGDNESMRPIVDQINLCTGKGIPVFAAASNDGIRSPRAFPARQDGVFCIHAGSHEGEAARFNPEPEKNKTNFLVLGCDILSSWQGRNVNGSGKKEYKSGTSFAVPVAVCIAAFMVAYIAKLDPDCDSWHIKPKSRQGLLHIFEAMIVESKYRRYDWISPCEYINQNQDGIILSNIRSKLNYDRKGWG